MSKPLRHQRIRELITAEPIYTQEELRKRLAQSGIHVNQATLSRDIRELEVVKTVNGYAFPGEIEAAAPLPSLTHLLREFLTDVREAENLLVLKTTPGSAQPVAAALDVANWEEVLGTIAGDDTILVVTQATSKCRRMAERIRQTIGT